MSWTRLDDGVIKRQTCTGVMLQDPGDESKGIKNAECRISERNRSEAAWVEHRRDRTRPPPRRTGCGVQRPAVPPKRICGPNVQLRMPCTSLHGSAFGIRHSSRS